MSGVWAPKQGKCDRCGKGLQAYLGLGVALMSYSKKYMIKNGYDGIELYISEEIRKQFKLAHLKGVFCLDCFKIVKKEHGFNAGEKEPEGEKDGE